MNLDELVRRADPARDLAIPAAHHAAARWDYAEVVGRRPAPARRKGMAVASGAVAACAVVVVVVALVLVPTVGSGTSAAAAVLEEAATATAGQQPTPLGPGQYQYTETTALYQLNDYNPEPTGSTMVIVAHVQYQQTTQSWLDAAGQGRTTSHRSAFQYSSPADEEAWDTDPGGASMVSGGGYSSGAIASANPHASEPIPDVAGLPTEPTALAAVIAAGEDGTAVNANVTGPATTFERAARLLIGPDDGMTPALASALYQVMATQPGITLVGRATAHDGKVGTAVALDVASGVSEVIVDPTTGALLEAQFAPTPPTVAKAGMTTRVCTAPSPSATTCSTSTPKALSQGGPLWIDSLASAVVGSDTATG